MSATTVWDCRDVQSRDGGIAGAVAAMRRGGLVVLPTENCYVVATDAFSVKGTALLRRAKVQASTTPLGLLVAGPGTVSGVAARVPPSAQVLMQTFWPGLLTLLMRPQTTLAWDHPPSAPVAVRMPLHPLALAVCQRVGPIAASAASIAGGPAPVTVEEAIEGLGDDVAVACDVGPVGEAAWSELEDPRLPSTVVDVRNRAATVVREGAIPVERVEAVLDELVGDKVADEPTG